MSVRSARLILASFILFCAVVGGGAWAKSPAPKAAGGPLDNLKLTTGPATVKLQDVATLALPAGFAFVGKEDTQKVLKENGNFPNGSEIGLVVAKDASFFIVVEYEETGHVKDDDAGKIDADAILKSYQEGTEASNAKRREHGESELHVTGWEEKPRYDPATHQVIWALVGKSGGHESVNYFTRMLGRKGVLSLNLVSGKDELAANKKRVATILQGTRYVDGQCYADFKPGEDKESEMGLTGLILAGGGVAAAAKLGILAKLGKFAIGILYAGKKLVVLVIMGVVALFSKLRGGGDKSTQEDASSSGPEPGA